METDPKKILENLREKPYETRVRILWITVVIAALILLGVWVISLKSTVQGLNVKNLVPSPTSQSNTAETTDKYIQVERVEANAKTLKIYFNINNTTDNILNFSDSADITLNANNASANPHQVADRQGGSFAKKILSHTQIFGILTFDPVTEDSGKLTFDNMSFENATDQIFKQVLNLDFKALEKSIDLRK